MQVQSRIPKLKEVTFDGALMWFSEMQCQKLLFHPVFMTASVIQLDA